MVTETTGVLAKPVLASCACFLCGVLIKNNWVLFSLYAAILLTCAAVNLHILFSCWEERKRRERKKNGRSTDRN